MDLRYLTENEKDMVQIFTKDSAKELAELPKGQTRPETPTLAPGSPGFSRLSLSGLPHIFFRVYEAFAGAVSWSLGVSETGYMVANVEYGKASPVDAGRTRQWFFLQRWRHFAYPTGGVSVSIP